MKSIAVYFLLILIVSCKKENDTVKVILPEDNGCIQRIQFPQINHFISAANAKTADSLFSSNTISFMNYRYLSFLHDSVQTYFPPYEKFDSKIIGVAQYVNRLRVFTGNNSYFFKNNIFISKTREVLYLIPVDTTSVLNTAQVRRLFVDDAERFEKKSKQFADSCLKTEFGYWDINLHNGPSKYIKVWYVTLLNRNFPSDYPKAYYKDGSGERIYYDNGIRQFN